MNGGKAKTPPINNRGGAETWPKIQVLAQITFAFIRRDLSISAHVGTTYCEKLMSLTGPGCVKMAPYQRQSLARQWVL